MTVVVVVVDVIIVIMIILIKMRCGHHLTDPDGRLAGRFGFLLDLSGLLGPRPSS